MKKSLGITLAAAAILGLGAVPANADVIYMSDGTALFSDPMIDTTVVRSTVIEPIETRVITHPAVIEPVTTRVITQPAVVSTPVHYNVLSQPAVIRDIDDDRNLLRLKLWPLVDFSLF